METINFVAFLFLLSVALIECRSSNYIIGGSNATIGQFPFIASLRSADNQHYCGASIISDSWFLTAAQCTQGPFLLPQNVFAWVGAHNRTDGIGYAIESIAVHPRFTARFMQNDIALLRSANNINFIPGRVQPIRLPPRDTEDSVPIRVWIAGWGFAWVS